MACTVIADGGPSGLGSLTPRRTAAPLRGRQRRRGRRSAPTASTRSTSTAVDGAGNAASADATVYVDRTAPGRDADRAPPDRRHRLHLPRRRQRRHLRPGRAQLQPQRRRLEGRARGGTFTVAKGAVRVRALDVAGNQALTTPVTLADRTPASKPSGRDVVERAGLPRRPQGRRTAWSARCAPRAAPSGTVSVDLRPLAVGRGKFRVEIKLKSGKRSRTIKRDLQGRPGRHAPADRRLARQGDRRSRTVTLTVRKQRRQHVAQVRRPSKVVLAEVSALKRAAAADHPGDR